MGSQSPPRALPSTRRERYNTRKRSIKSALPKGYAQKPFTNGVKFHLRIASVDIPKDAPYSLKEI